MQGTTRTIVLIVGILLVLALVYFGFQFFMYQQAVRQLPVEGTSVVFVDDGVGERYLLQNQQLVRTLDSSRTDGVVIYESAPSPLSAGDTVVLASVDGTRGLVAGLVAADQTFTPLATGDTNKAELSVGSGLAVFTATPVSEEPPIVAADESDENAVEESFTAANPTGPVASQPATVGSDLIAVDIATGAITSLGAGRSPRVLSDGSVLALGLEGVVRINPQTGVRTLVIPAPTANAVNGHIAPSGSLVALPQLQNSSIEFYRITAQGAEHIGFLDRGEGGPMRIAIVDDDRFFLRTSEDAAWLYRMPTEKLPIANPYAVLPLIQP